ncbi:MAG TPA: hypothetical protein VK517_18705 [Cyclobacteriaceae bacterium]|nr:hypothetical protein [Cyclobacteriaceae bacterium]
MKKQITLFLFMMLVMTVLFLKRMSAVDASQRRQVKPTVNHENQSGFLENWNNTISKTRKSID